MKPSRARFFVVIIAAFVLVQSRGRLTGNGHKEDSSEATMLKHDSGSLRGPMMRVGQTHQTQSWGRKGSQRPPRIYFLFLAVSKVANFDVWKSFFNIAPRERYRALIHCKGAACKLFASKSKLLKLVPTVDSTYCSDLVSPMNQLLAMALKDDPASANPGDKFVFVSDSTLPAKPFWNVYDTLNQRDGSDICMFPAKDWADVPVKLVKDGTPGRGHELAIKTHQWIVLSRSHSERSVHLWNEGVMHDIMTNFRLNQATLWQDPGNRTFGDNRNFGCLDEFWHMYVLFGPWTITDAKETAEYHYSDLTNSPVQIKAGAGWQGACDTFALWSEYTRISIEPSPNQTTSATSPWMKLYSALDQESIPHSSSSGPAWWDTISRKGIQAIRDSDFLFVRKFIDKPTLANGGDFGKEYSRIVLTS